MIHLRLIPLFLLCGCAAPPAAVDAALTEEEHLVAGTWGNYLGAVSNNCLTNSPSQGNLFFRLKQ
jgi:hypothetical protein